MTFKELVEKHLRRKKITLAAFEKTLGYDNPQSAHIVIQGAMSGKRPIPQRRIPKFATALGVTEEVLQPFATRPKGRKRRARREKVAEEVLFTVRDLQYLVGAVKALGPLPMQLLVEHALLNRRRKGR